MSVAFMKVGKIMTALAMVSALSLAGAGLLAFPHGWSLAPLAWGDALMVGAAFLRGVMVCLTRRQGQRHGLPALTLTAVQMALLGAFLYQAWSAARRSAAPGPSGASCCTAARTPPRPRRR